MSLKNSVRTTLTMLSLIVLTGCSLEAAITTCADCGEVRSITPRPLRNEIHLLTDAPQVVAVSGAAPVPVIYHVRIRMDRGGSRDFILSNLERLRVGERVEVRQGRVIPRPAGDSWS
jgi:hypothetical protein